MVDDLCRLTAEALSVRLRDGEITAELLARACLARIAAREADVRAWSYVDPDAVIRQARELGKLPSRGPLHGIPIGVKDIYNTADMPTQHNSPIYTGHRPNTDAATVGTLRAAGALILGKTDTMEFASTGRLAATRNPHNLARTPGGSSSGSAAAVGDFHVPLALGTQTGGSLIRPGSFCGDPITNRPAGTTVMRGQSGQSRNVCGAAFAGADTAPSLKTNAIATNPAVSRAVQRAKAVDVSVERLKRSLPASQRRCALSSVMLGEHGDVGEGQQRQISVNS